MRACVVLGLVFHTKPRDCMLGERFRNDLFCVEWDVKPQLSQLECGPMPNMMVALPNTGGALCSTPQFG